MADFDHSADVLLVSGDLFLGSRVRGAVELRGVTLEVAGSGTMAVEKLRSGGGFRLVLVDLETPGLRIDELVAAREGTQPSLIAYGPHVQEKRLDAARKAGCDQVLTRGQFDATLPDLVQQFLT